MKVTYQKTISTPNAVQGWKEIIGSSIVSSEQLTRYFDIDAVKLQKVISIYPMRINPYFMSLIKEENDPLWKQVIPDVKEIEDHFHSEDPLHEELQSPVLNLIHRYPDRVLFMVSNQCAVLCRYCMRKRKVGYSRQITKRSLIDGLNYIRKTKNISEVILSGGDPLLLDDGIIKWILIQLRSISHVDVIRIHTRTPSALPQRVTDNLVNILKQFHPLYINVHFNHPAEITDVASNACIRLADAGVPLGCQTVLLKGINDNPAVLRELMQKLLRIRVRPYYLHHADPVKGTIHFRTTIRKGLEILEDLRTRISGLSIPSYVVDLPGGGGKSPLQPVCAKYKGSVKSPCRNIKRET